MRIVHVLNGHGPIYGVERHVLTLAAAQRARGHTIMAMTNIDDEFADACRVNGIQITVNPRLEPMNDHGLYLDEQIMENAIKGLGSQLADFRADLIHCHNPLSASLAIPAANRAHIPCFLTLHIEPKPEFFSQTKHLRFAVIAVSTLVFNKAQAVVSPGTDLYLIPNGTQTMPPENTNSRKPYRPNLMMVGTLHPLKGVDAAISAMFRLHLRLGHDCPTLNVYGSGQAPWVDFYKEMAAVLGLADIVLFHGSRPGILRDCPAGDILIVASRNESGPLVVLEAMSRGMPIVTSRVGEVTEMLPDKRYGRIVPVNSITGLADAVESTLRDVNRGRFEPELVIARHRSFFSDIAMAQRTEEIYAAVMSKQAAARPGGHLRPGAAGQALRPDRRRAG
jgi:glycosyltransferase involved in cell wall biosynthesis